MPRLHRNIKLAVLVAIIVLLIIGIYRQSLTLYRGVKDVQLPNQQSRRISDFGVYNWITVPELAEKHSVSEEKIFQLLGIVPVPEDYQLSLKNLRLKYHKTPEEMRNAIKIIIDSPQTQSPSPKPEPPPRVDHSRDVPPPSHPTSGGPHE